MTEMLWYLDCYTHQWTAKVVEVVGNEIVLDRTYFYPESGGQPNDFGIISHDFMCFNVLGSRKSEGKVFHKVDNKEELFRNSSNLVYKVVYDKEGLKVGDIVYLFSS